jgi:heme/copper-type cytochrome/quinol oxidase subunit 1
MEDLWKMAMESGAFGIAIALLVINFKVMQHLFRALEANSAMFAQTLEKQYESQNELRTEIKLLISEIRHIPCIREKKGARDAV